MAVGEGLRVKDAAGDTLAVQLIVAEGETLRVCPADRVCVRDGVPEKVPDSAQVVEKVGV